MKKVHSIAVLVPSIALIFILVSCSGKTGKQVQTSTGGKSIEITDNQSVSEWREENRSGVSSETGLLKVWPESGPELIWSNSELPKGHSSVTFGNNSVYLTGNDGKNDLLVALDPEGKIRWKTEYGRSWTASNPESRSTPTVEGNRVYVSSGNGDLACIDGVSGSIIWSLRASETFKGTFGEWGIAESLLLDGEKLFFSPGGPETMTIALNKTTGELIWKSASLNDGPAYVSPIVIDYAGKRILVNVSLNYIYAIDVSNGNILWKVNHVEAIDSKKSKSIWPDAPLIKCVTPLYSDGKIYVTGGYDHGAIMLSMNEDGSAVKTEWIDTVLDVHHGGVVLVNGYIYGANWLDNSDGNWCCIEWETGKKIWEEHWKCKGSVISAEGMLYILDEKSGNIGLVKVSPEKFDIVSSFRVKAGSGPYWSHPVIHNKMLFIRHGEYLGVYSIKSN